MLCMVQKQTRLRVVDNSAIGKAAMMEGKPPKVIQVYSKRKFGYTGLSNKLTFIGFKLNNLYITTPVCERRKLRLTVGESKVMRCLRYVSMS